MKKWFNLFTVLIAISVALTLYFSYIVLKYDYIGAMVEIKGDKVYIADVEPLTWADKNLEIGDRVLLVNGENPLKFKPIKEWNMLEQAKVVTIEKSNGELKNLSVEANFDSQIVFMWIIPLIVIVISIYCSYLIYKSYKRSENTRESALMLIVFLFTFSLAYMCGGASARGDNFSRTIVVLLLIATPGTYLHFMYTYYKELNLVWFSKKWIWISYLIILTNSILVEFDQIFFVNGTLTKTINLASFLVIFIMVASLIGIGLKKITYKTQKYLIRILVISNAFAFLPFLLLYVLPYVLFKVTIISPVFLTGFLMIIPFSLVYQFLATKIYDIEFIVGRIKYYSLIITVPSVVTVLMVINIKSENVTVFSIRTFIIIFLLMFATLYLKEVFDFKFKLNRFSEKLNYQDRLTVYTQKIRIAKNIYEVSSILKQTIVDVMLINEAYLLEIDKDGRLADSLSHKRWLFDKYLDNINSLRDEIGRIEEIDKGFLLNIGEAENKTYIILALSDINTPILTIDEKQWLNNLAYYTNVTLENFVKIEHLMENLEELENNPTWLNKIVFNLEEKQRSELAKDLHDSVLQDLINTKRKTEVLYSKYKNMDEEDIEKEFHDLIDGMSKSIEITRKTCHELRPQFLYDLGLDNALKKLVNQHQNNRYRITIATSNLDQSISEDVQLNLYRITQELLNNAKKHSEAKNVRLIVVKTKDKIVLHYEDDGLGEDLDFVLNKEGSMGLSGIRERVRVLDGTIDIQTEPGQGFKVVIEV
ncbi:ATP-binding protein [uncultured Metabacillus sp.]|uniref:sensor histidine kinase n=1 Tax=uncultured Metabacillus sp. TaxID=2860135 RepID=UPI00262844D7|nr:ATP-binding protein [uncultured Metabacillus sp.]